MPQRMYRLYVEMTDRRDRRTNVWRRVSSDEPLTHREALTMRSKMMRPAAVLLVEADSQAERDMEPFYKNWSYSLDELITLRRDKIPPSNKTPHAGHAELDCGDSSCRYATKKGGMRTNGGCSCDDCLECGASIRLPFKHRAWCKQPNWVPPHQDRRNREN